MRCPECDEKIPNDSKECPECGERIKKSRKSEKNWLALLGYYLGVVALIPYVALVIGPVAVLLGIGGIVYGVQNPRAKSMGHCITALVLSTLGLIGTVVIMYLVSKDYLDSPTKFFKKS
jgi:predicted nucleic acid-binding Zn ribbon protein